VFESVIESSRPPSACIKSLHVGRGSLLSGRFLDRLLNTVIPLVTSSFLDER
jgi:hypothetical protein